VAKLGLDLPSQLICGSLLELISIFLARLNCEILIEIDLISVIYLDFYFPVSQVLYLCGGDHISEELPILAFQSHVLTVVHLRWKI
jgi:hypothetical protein